MLHLIKIALISTFSVALVCSAASAQTTLRYKFKEGEKLEYVIEQKASMTRSVMNMDVQSKMILTRDLVWNIVAVNRDGSAQVQIKTTRATMTLDEPTGVVKVDSTHKDDSDEPIRKAALQQVKAMAAVELAGTIQPTGAMDLKASGGGFDPEMFKAMIGNITFPTNAVAKGKTWTNKHECKTVLGKMILENTYAYEGAAPKGLEKISIRADVKIEPMPNSPIKEIKETRGSGQVLFDNKSGRLIEVVVNQYVQMEGIFAGMNVQQTSDQTTTIRLKK